MQKTEEKETETEIEKTKSRAEKKTFKKENERKIHWSSSKKCHAAKKGKIILKKILNYYYNILSCFFNFNFSYLSQKCKKLRKCILQFFYRLNVSKLMLKNFAKIVLYLKNQF